MVPVCFPREKRETSPHHKRSNLHYIPTSKTESPAGITSDGGTASWKCLSEEKTIPLFQVSRKIRGLPGARAFACWLGARRRAARFPRNAKKHHEQNRH